MQRMKAIKQAQDRVDNIEWVEIEEISKSGGEKAAKRIIEEYKHPVAVFCLNDEMAIGLYNQITETSSLMIGEQIHLIGFDNIELTRYMPRAAAIDYSKRKWGPSQPNN